MRIRPLFIAEATTSCIPCLTITIWDHLVRHGHFPRRWQILRNICTSMALEVINDIRFPRSSDWFSNFRDDDMAVWSGTGEEVLLIMLGMVSKQRTIKFLFTCTVKLQNWYVSRGKCRRCWQTIPTAGSFYCQSWSVLRCLLSGSTQMGKPFAGCSRVEKCRKVQRGHNFLLIWSVFSQ